MMAPLCTAQEKPFHRALLSCWNDDSYKDPRFSTIKQQERIWNKRFCISTLGWLSKGPAGQGVWKKTFPWETVTGSCRCHLSPEFKNPRNYFCPICQGLGKWSVPGWINFIMSVWFHKEMESFEQGVASAEHRKICSVTSLCAALSISLLPQEKKKTKPKKLPFSI